VGYPAAFRKVSPVAPAGRWTSQSLAILNRCFGSASESRNNCKITVDRTVTMGLWAQHGRLRAFERP